MAQWGRNDQSVTANSTTVKETSSGAPIGTYALVKGSGRGTNPVSMSANSDFGNTSPGSKASIDASMYGNTTVGAYINNMAVGVFGVTTGMLNTIGGNVDITFVTYPGTGYGANTANFTPTAVNGGSGASINAVANSMGKISSLNIVSAGSGYIKSPTLSIPAPASITVYANSTTVNTSSNTILLSTANSRFQPTDRLFYSVPTGNTPIVGLTGNTYYYVTFSNTTAIAVANTVGGANLQLTANGTSTESHSIVGDTALGYVDVSSGYPQVSHAGWVVRREGTGGRAGRIHYETLVAFGSLGAQTAPYGTPATVASNTSVDSLI